MSAIDEKRAEDSVKSAHKKDKKRKAREEAEAAATTIAAAASEASTSVAVEESAEAKALRKAEKREKKRRKEEKKAAKKAAAESPISDATPIATTSAAAVAAAPSSSSTSNGAVTDAASANAFLQEHNITLEAPEESNEKPPLPFLSFKELRGKVDDSICDELDTLKFQKPTPIQACCWPVILTGNDVVGIAETGSGKTFAFGVPALQHLVSKGKGKGKSSQINVLVVAPTRELAKQTHDNLLMLAPSLGFGSICLFGGVPKQDQMRDLRKSSSNLRIVVGTPGRVLDFAREGVLDLSAVSYLVLDEADRMLDKGFEPDIRAIIGMTQTREAGRRTNMFSATWPPAVRGLAETFMNAPIRVTVGSDELHANRRVEQRVEVLEDNRAKDRRLQAVLREIGAGPRGKNAQDKVLIFALYKKEAARIEETLRRNGYSVSGLHGDMTQPQRMASLDAFKNGVTPLLVATDVAARGLDIPNVEYVINVTFPLTVDEYVHRIGRTGRAGKTGKSITFFTGEDKAHAGELVRVLRDANQEVPQDLMAFPMAIKKKTHSAYGDHFGELVPGKAKKIVFD